jgi:putative ABC transport system permease protein
MKTLWQNLIYGFRMLLKKPGFTAVAALSLALGIGANTVVFSLINTTLLRPLDYPDSSKLVVVWSVPLQHRDQRNNVNFSTFSALRDRAQSFEVLGAVNGGAKSLGADQDGAPAERINGDTFTPSMFRALGVKPMLGRIYTETEDALENPAPVVLISYNLWQRHFNGDRNVVGKTLALDKVTNTVIGVLPKEFNFFGDDTDFLAPLPISRMQALSKTGFLLAVGRLKPGVSIRQAQTESDTIAAQLAAGDPERNQGNGVQVQSLQEAAYGEFRQPLLILQGAVGFVLLIGCANVAGLLLARAASRRTEIAIRTALGAGRWRMVRQLLTESFPLSLLGGVLGVFLSWAGLKLFVAVAPPNFPRLNEVTLDLSVLGFTALVVIVTGLIFAIVPAIQATNPDLVSSLKESGRSGTVGVARQHMRSLLVTVQIALALVLLIGAGLMINSFLRVQNTSVGADPSNLLTFDFRIPQDEVIKPYSRYRGVGLWDVNPQAAQTYDRVLERMQNLPGVVSAAAINRQPLNNSGISMPFLIEGRPAPPPSAASSGGSQQTGQTANYYAITPGFFATLKIPMLRGRDFDKHDTLSAPLVVAINQTMARRFFPNEEPVGKSITLDFVPDERPREIIAVVGDTVSDRFQRDHTPVVYVPQDQQTPRWLGPFWGDRAGMNFILRTSAEPMSMMAAVKHAVAEVDPSKPAANFRTMEQLLDRQVQYMRLYIALLAVFGVTAAVLAAIGIYGVMAYSVAERTREIGIRMALGAGARDVLGLVVRQALILVSIGVVLGLSASFALTRVIKSALYGVTATDPATYAGVSALLLVVALLASFIPTRRAVAVDPTIALRYE